MTIPKFLTSSVNPEQLGLTVKAALVAIVPVVLVITGLTHINLGQQELTEIIDGIVSLVVTGTALLSAVMGFIGVMRKIGVRLGWIKSNV